MAKRPHQTIEITPFPTCTSHVMSYPDTNEMLQVAAKKMWKAEKEWSKTHSNALKTLKRVKSQKHIWLILDSSPTNIRIFPWMSSRSTCGVRICLSNNTIPSMIPTIRWLLHLLGYSKTLFLRNNFPQGERQNNKFVKLSHLTLGISKFIYTNN